MRLIDRIATILVLLMTATVVMYGQAAEPDIDTEHGAGVCGFQLMNDGHDAEGVAATAKVNPALYQKMLHRAKYGSRDIDEVRLQGDYVFFVRQRSAPYNFYEVPATLRYDGKLARIWVDDLDNSRVTASTINTLAIRLDSITSSISRDPNKGILQNDIEVFGATPKTFEQEGKTDFLITDIKDSLVGAFVAGYFNPYDQTSNPGSNQLNLLYIDSKEGLASGMNAVSNTLAHEFQHLIHFNTNPSSDRLFNEGCSEAASIICGYPDRRMGEFFANTNIDLFRWTFDDGAKILADYSRAMTLVYYLFEQFGESYLTTFNSTRTDGILRIRDAMANSGRGDDWRAVLRNWSVANYLQRGYSDARYIYQKNDNLANRKPAVVIRYDTNLATASNSVTLAPYAQAYVDYGNPKAGQYGLRATFNSTGNAGVMAILYRRNAANNGDSCVGVIDIPLRQQVFLGEFGAYSKVTFALVNTEESSFTTTVDWTVAGATLGVDEDRSTRGGLSLASIAPNPVANMANVEFTIPSPGPATIDLFDIQGRLVRRLVDGIQYEPGRHSLRLDVNGIPDGSYFLRLMQGGSIVNRTVMVGSGE